MVAWLGSQEITRLHSSFIPSSGRGLNSGLPTEHRKRPSLHFSVPK